MQHISELSTCRRPCLVYADTVARVLIRKGLITLQNELVMLTVFEEVL